MFMSMQRKWSCEYHALHRAVGGENGRGMALWIHLFYFYTYIGCTIAVNISDSVVFFS